MARDYRACAKEAFAPLVEACGFLRGADLITADLPQDRRDFQFARFKALRVERSRAAPISNGGFVAVLKEEDRELILVCAPSLNDQEVADLQGALVADIDCNIGEFDEATFLVAIKELSGFLKLKIDSRQASNARDFLDILDDEYLGHSIEDLIARYNSVLMLEIDAANALYESDLSAVILKITSHSRHLRSPILSDVVASAIFSLEGKAGCNSFNLEQAINAAQWRHAFLDIYRCLESLFFFPWMLKIKSMAIANTSVFEIRDRCRKDLNWSAKEKDSISELFLLVNSPEMDSIENSSDLFSSLVGDKDAKRDSFGRLVYSARNALVHHEDRERPGANPYRSEDYEILTLYLCEFLSAFDKKFGAILR